MHRSRTRAGKYVAPSSESAAVTLVGLPMNRDLTFDPINADTAVYPITAPTWLVVSRCQPDPRKAAALTSFLRFAHSVGQQIAEDLGYVKVTEDAAASREGTDQRDPLRALLTRRGALRRASRRGSGADAARIMQVKGSVRKLVRSRSAERLAKFGPTSRRVARRHDRFQWTARSGVSAPRPDVRPPRRHVDRGVRRVPRYSNGGAPVSDSVPS